MLQEECSPAARVSDTLSQLKLSKHIAERQQNMRYQYHPESMSSKNGIGEAMANPNLQWPSLAKKRIVWVALIS